jgi:hypothetical protein
LTFPSRHCYPDIATEETPRRRNWEWVRSACLSIQESETTRFRENAMRKVAVIRVMALVSMVLLTSCCIPGPKKETTSKTAPSTSQPSGGAKNEQINGAIIGTWAMEMPKDAAQFMKTHFIFGSDGSVIERVIFDRRKSLEGMKDPQVAQFQRQQWGGDLSVKTTDKSGNWTLVSPGRIEIRYTKTTDPEGLAPDDQNPTTWDGFVFEGNSMKAILHFTLADAPQQEEQTFQRLQTEQAGADTGPGAVSPKGREIKGITFTGIAITDFVHLGFEAPTGKEYDLSPGAEGMDYFVAVHKEVPMDVRVVTEMVDTPGGEKMQMDIIQEISAGGTPYTQWWAEQKAKMTMEEIRKTYDPIVLKVTQ